MPDCAVSKVIFSSKITEMQLSLASHTNKTLHLRAAPARLPREQKGTEHAIAQADRSMQALGESQASQFAAVDDVALSMYSPPPELRPFAVQGAPQGAFYIPNFIDASTEEMLLQV